MIAMQIKLRWGILSTAKIGLEHVIPAMQRGQLTTVNAIASRDLDRARQAASKLGIPTAYGSYEELPEWFSFTSARNSQFSHSRVIQKRWLAGPSPVMAPSTTFQLPGFSLACQPSRVFPSNMLIQPSLPACGAFWGAPAQSNAASDAAAQMVIHSFFIDLSRSMDWATPYMLPHPSGARKHAD